MGLNLHGVRAIYRFEMNRALRTWMQSLLAPVLTTSLYFIVFGSAIGSRMGDIGGVSYGAYIIPGLLMLCRPPAVTMALRKSHDAYWQPRSV